MRNATGLELACLARGKCDPKSNSVDGQVWWPRVFRRPQSGESLESFGGSCLSNEDKRRTGAGARISPASAKVVLVLASSVSWDQLRVAVVRLLIALGQVRLVKLQSCTAGGLDC